MKHALAPILFCGCLAIPNPWFELDTNDSGRPETSGTPDSSGGMIPSTSSGGMIPTTSGDPSTSSSGSSESSNESSTSNEPIPTSEGSGLSSTSESSEASGSSEGSTGEPENLHADLYELCPVPGVAWWGGAGANIFLQCNEGDLPGVSQIPELQIDGKDETSILNISPSLEPMGAMEGRYPFAPLDPNQAMTATVLAKVHCPTAPDPMKPCSANATIEAQVNNVTVLSAQASLEDGTSESLLLDLSLSPEILGGEDFEIVLRVDVGDSPGPHDRIYFIRPRVTI